MSNLKVEIVKIDEVLEHGNADRLELARVAGWQCVIGKGSFSAGDLAVYIPIDSVMGETLENHLFPPGSKVTLSKHRVKSVKIRGALSQGMLINPRDEGLLALFPDLRKKKEGDDVSDALGITKYEPPLPPYQRRAMKRAGSWKNNPLFTKYTDIENFKHYPDLFTDGELISITEKLHGTSARYGVYTRNPNVRFGRLSHLWRKITRKPEHEFVYGSRQVQLQTGGKLYYDSNVYAEAAQALNLENILQPGEALYGEIVGPGIQKKYSYGFDVPTFFAYDVKVNNVYLNPADFRTWCTDRHIPMVPVLYEGRRDCVDLRKINSGASVLAPEAQPIMEGVVIKPQVERLSIVGRAVLKLLNDDYLLQKDTSDYH